MAALGNRAASNAPIELGGPDALSPLEVVRLAGQMTGRSFEIQHVLDDALRARYGAATDSLQQSFAALMPSYAFGSVIDTTEMLHTFPGQPLTSVRGFLAASSAGV